MESSIIKELENRAVEGEIACADAHDIARLFDITPIELSKQVNRNTDLRFNRCQLGLFGFGPKAEGKSKIVLRATNIPPEIEAALQAKATNGRISCAAVWEIADQFKYPRLGIANIIETLDLRVKPCQLGCF
ncbi:MAG: hypothetical protein GX552_13975 [Chloroflexi bacterium]|jgi:hypothetical protein|nr:hypothetical protein [Chloroflexota bacterium]